MNIMFNDIPFSGEAIAIKDGAVIWSNHESGDCPPEIATLHVLNLYVVDNVLVFELN